MRSDIHVFVIPALTHFRAIFSSYTLQKHQGTRDFLMFSGGIKIQRSLEMEKSFQVTYNRSGYGQ